MPLRTVSNTGGNWNATSTWVGGVVPIAGDTVDFTATSGNLTVNTNTANLAGIDFTNYINTIYINSIIYVSGAINLGTGGYTQLGTNGLTIINTSTITSNGTVWSRTLTFSNATSTTTLSSFVNVNYASTAFNACYAPTATFTMAGNTSSFCTSTTFTSGGWGGIATGTYYISYGGSSMQVSHTFGQGFATSSGSCVTCPATTTTTTTTTTTAAPTTTTTTTISGYTVNVYAQRNGLATGPIVFIYRSTDGVNFVTSGVTVNRTPGALMYTLTIPSGTTLYLQQVNTQTSVASNVTATTQLNSYPASATGGNCQNAYTITSAANIYLYVNATDACVI
jgi:hypothetical protein